MVLLLFLPFHRQEIFSRGFCWCPRKNFRFNCHQNARPFGLVCCEAGETRGRHSSKICVDNFLLVKCCQCFATALAMCSSKFIIRSPRSLFDSLDDEKINTTEKKRAVSRLRQGITAETIKLFFLTCFLILFALEQRRLLFY